MGNRTWILQIMFFSVVPYSVLISLRNSDVLAITERSLINIEKEDLNGIAKTNDNEITSEKITDNNKTIVVKDIERKSITLIKNGIFWSDYAESCVPKGSSTNDSFTLIKKLRSQNIKTLKEGTTYMCGTSKGGIVTLQDGTIMCAKYKRKQRSVYAEVLSYYLSRLLNMDNLPEVFLAQIDPSSPRWKDVDPRKLSWDEDEIIALVTWQKNCKLKTLMPATIREAYFRQETITSKLINSSWTLQNNPGMLSELIQWGTILIFDDLIGHFDRLVRMQPYGDENRYDVHADSLHNSVKSSNGKIWLIDHESAFFYRYKYFDSTYNYIRIVPFYDKMLKTMCIFQSSFVEGLKKISEHSSAFEFLWEFTLSHEPLMRTISKELRSKMYATIFDYRLNQIMEWIQHCKAISIKEKR